MTVPNWYSLALLSLAAFRIFRLLSEDDILNRPRAWLLGYTGWDGEGRPPNTYRANLGTFIVCRWCLGFWLALAWWGAYEIWPHATVVVAVPLAVSTLLAFIAGVLEDE